MFKVANLGGFLWKLITSIALLHVPFSKQKAMGSEILHIIYYLDREGMLEEPHLLEVPLPACNGGGLHLIDVKRWLMLTRGNSMPASFSWSFKRNYKAGCIWQDVSADEDLILPSSEGEYILKGSKLVATPKEGQWPMPVLREEPSLTSTSSMHTKYDGIRIIGDGKKMSTENTNRLLASNQGDVNIGEDSCSLALSYHSQKSDIIYDMEHIHVDQRTMGSSYVTVNDHLLINSNLSLPKATHELAENAEEKGEMKLHGDSKNNVALALSDDQLPTLFTAMVLQPTQPVSNTDNKLSESSITEKASLYHVPDKGTICGSPPGATSCNTDFTLMPRATTKPDKGTICGSPPGVTSCNTDFTLMPRATTKPVNYKTNVCNEHAGDTVELQTQACPYAESTTVRKGIDYKTVIYDLHAADRAEPPPQACPCAENKHPLRSKYTRSNSSVNPLYWASCMAEDSYVMGTQGKPLNKCSNKMIDSQRSIKTKWGCNNTTVLPSHVKVNSLGNVSASKPPVPFSRESNDHILEGIASKILSRDKKICSNRVTYSDQLGIKLPATMAISGQKSAPMCSSQQRLAPGKTTVGSSYKSAHKHKNATSHYLQKTRLPVFGSENRQHQHFEELEWFDTDSTRNISKRALEPPYCFYTRQDSKLPTHGHHECGKFHGRHHHDHAELKQDRANLSTKILWEKLLQATQQVFTSQETI